MKKEPASFKILFSLSPSVHSPFTEGIFLPEKAQNPAVSIQWIAVFPADCYHRGTTGRDRGSYFADYRKV